MTGGRTSRAGADAGTASSTGRAGVGGARRSSNGAAATGRSQPSRSRLDRLVAFFRGAQRAPAARRAVLLTDPRRFAGAQSLVAGFYAALAFFAIANLYSWPAWLAASDPTPRWPVFWLRFVGLHAGIAAILWLNLIAGILGVLLCGYRTARVLVALSWLEMLAFKYSFGSINHGDHLGLLLAVVLVFLPGGWHRTITAPRSVRARTLLVFSAAQAMIALTYSMSGAWKAGGMLEQLLRGEVGYFAPTGLARQVAAKLLEDDAPSLLGPWLIDHAWLGWPLGIGAIYVELFALWAVARPRLHQLWGVGLVLLHVGSHLLLGVGFAQNCLWAALFLVSSPLRPERFEWRAVVADLPVVGAVWRGRERYRKGRRKQTATVG